MIYNHCDIPLFGCEGYFEKTVGITECLLKEI